MQTHSPGVFKTQDAGSFIETMLYPAALQIRGQLPQYWSFLEFQQRYLRLTTHLKILHNGKAASVDEIPRPHLCSSRCSFWLVLLIDNLHNLCWFLYSIDWSHMMGAS